MNSKLILLFGLLNLWCLDILSADEPQANTKTKSASKKPNVLFISIDDLNDWIGCLGGHPQTKTPNFDRLANSGILFSNAHCPAPACNPSRTSIMTGMAPNVSGLYDNRQKMREVLPKAELLPKYFSRHGYWSGGSGKLLHYFIDANSWDEYFPKKETERPLPFTLYPDKRPVNLPRGGPWQYIETDWGALDVSDQEFGGDYSVSKWVGEKLSKQHDQPFFLACGIYRPHEPWFVPKKYFDLFPLDKIQLPKGYKADDLADLPGAGKSRGPNRYFAHIQKNKQWKKAVQGYLASIAFSDAMLGRVLDALEKGPNSKNTIVVLWSDHGWHLGEKEHWQKYTAWRACTRVPLMIRVPKGVTGLPNGTVAGLTCDEPVNLVSLYPTLLELCGLPAKDSNKSPSLVPLLKNNRKQGTGQSPNWPHSSITFLGDGKSCGISLKQWRYIKYGNGDHELYNIKADPYEWNNLLASEESAKQHAEVVAKFAPLLPKNFAPLKKASVGSLSKLKWNNLKREEQAPPSKPDGNSFDVFFINRTEKPVELFWMSPQGKTKSYGQIESGKRKRQQTRPGAVWMIASPLNGPIGYFRVDDRTAQAIIPKLD